MIAHYLRFLGSRNTLLQLRCVSSRPVFSFGGEKKTTDEKNISLSSDVDKPENGKKPNGKDQVQQEKEGQNGSSKQVHYVDKPENGKKPNGKDQVQVQEGQKEVLPGKEHSPNPYQVQTSPEKPITSQDINLLINAILQQNRRKEKARRHQYKFQSWMVVGTFICSLCGAGFLIYAQIQKWMRKRELLYKYGTKEQEVKPYYVKGNSIENYFRSELKHFGDIVHIYSGSSGSGKSAALRFLVNEMRQQGKQVFYCNLRDQDQKKASNEVNSPKNDKQSESNLNINSVLPKDKKQSDGNGNNKDNSPTDERKTESLQKTHIMIKELPELMDLAESRSTWTKRSVLIIDDANIFETESQLKEIYLRLTNLPHYGVDVFMISSSSSYCQKAKMDSVIQKKSQFYVVQQKNPEEKREQIESIMSHFSMSDQKQSIDYLCDQDHSLRKVVRLVSNFVQNKQLMLKQYGSFFKYIEKKDNKQFENYSQTVKKSLRKNKINSEILKEMVKISGKVQDSDCTSLRKRVDQEQRESNLNGMIQFCRELDRHNMIFYCHPRSNFFRRVFEKKIKEMEKGGSKTKWMI